MIDIINGMYTDIHNHTTATCYSIYHNNRHYDLYSEDDVISWIHKRLQRLSTSKRHIYLFGIRMRELLSMTIAPVGSRNALRVNQRPFITHLLDNTNIQRITLLDVRNLFADIYTNDSITTTITDQTTSSIQRLHMLNEDIHRRICDLCSITKVRRPYTISQIAISSYMQWLSNHPDAPTLLAKKEPPRMWFPKQERMVHASAKGGLVHVFQPDSTMEYEDTMRHDVNSLWPYGASIMDYPDLRFPEYRLQGKLQDGRTGILRCAIRTGKHTCGISSLLITKKGVNIAVPPESIAVGTFTYPEIRYELSKGGKIIASGASLSYPILNMNPLKEYFTTIYEQRRTCTDPFTKWLHKQLLNRTIGKFFQTKNTKRLVITTHDRAEELVNQGLKIVDTIDHHYVLREDDTRPKPFYQPILYSLITSTSRIAFHTLLHHVHPSLLYYCDTDCIIHGDKDHTLPVDDTLGNLKLEKHGERFKLYGKKTYMLGDELKVAGTPIGSIDTTDFELGEFSYIRAKTYKEMSSTSDPKPTVLIHKHLHHYIPQHHSIYIDDMTDITFIRPLLDKVFPWQPSPTTSTPSSQPSSSSSSCSDSPSTHHNSSCPSSTATAQTTSSRPS